MTALKIGFVPIVRSTFDTELAAQITAQARRQLASAGFDLVGPQEPVMDIAAAQTVAADLQTHPLDLLLIFQATFADATATMALVEGNTAPVLLWAIPEAPSGGRLRLNSLCGINLSAFSLRQADLDFDYIYAHPGDETVIAKVKTLAQTGKALRALKSARVGVIGKNPDGFDPCKYQGPQLKAQLGVEVVPIELQSFFAKVKAQSADRIEARYQTVSQTLSNLPDLDETSVRGTLGTFETLSELSKEELFNGVAMRCWPEFFTELGCAACGAMSMMTDSGTPCSCEADVNGTVTQIMLQALSGEPAFGTDLVSADTEDDTMVFWHCGLAPLSMADPSVKPQGTIHSNRKLPLLMEFPLKPGRVTIARLTESKNVGYRLVIGRGEMLARPNSFSGTSGVCRPDNPVAAVLDVIMTEGLDHHISITYGDYFESLVKLADILGLPIVYLTD